MRTSWHTLALAPLLLGAGCPLESTKPERDAAANAMGDAAGESMCTVRAQQAAKVIDKVVDEHRHCTSKADCQQVSIDSLCHAACGALVGTGGQAAVNAALAQLNAGDCRSYESDGCTNFAPPCLPPGGEPDCVGTGEAAHCDWAVSSNADAGTQPESDGGSASDARRRAPSPGR